MIPTIVSVSALLLSFAILCLGHGLQNTLLGVRATIEHYPAWVTGVMMSGYFLGFIFGSSLCARLISIVGQVRTFAAFASIASAISLLHVIFVNEITWIILRLIYGVCIAGLYVVIESWLNALSNRKNRGRILSLYMIISFLCLSSGQFFIFFAEPSEFVLFAVVSILISVALVPLTVSRTKQPDIHDADNFGFYKLFKISPLATFGCVGTGLTLGAFWGLGAVYFTQIGYSSHDVALVIGVTYLGGLLFQWPIGTLSDLFNRRVTITVVLFLSVLTCIAMVYLYYKKMDHMGMPLFITAILFGGFSYTLYSLFIALANDYLEPKYLVRATGGLIVLHAIGAIFGPILASVAMTYMDSVGMFVFIAFIHSLVFLVAFVRSFMGKEIPEETSENFVSIPKTGSAVIELDPRQE